MNYKNIMKYKSTKNIFIAVSGLSLVSAWRTHQVSASYPVPFDTVGAHIGNMWDPNTHKFTM